jgi:hypothetical protein
MQPEFILLENVRGFEVCEIKQNKTKQANKQTNNKQTNKQPKNINKLI